MIETIEAPVSPETVTPLKLSEALRLGRLIRPRRTAGQMFQGTAAACALGAIAAAGGVVAGDPEIWDAERVFPELEGDAVCPADGDECDNYPGGDSVAAIITDLNDDHLWSDDQIVAWLEGLGL